MPKITIELTGIENEIFNVINADGAQQWIENAAKERARVGLIDIRNKLVAKGHAVTGNDLIDISAYDKIAKAEAKAEAEALAAAAVLAEAQALKAAEELAESQALAADAALAQSEAIKEAVALAVANALSEKAKQETEDVSKQ